MLQAVITTATLLLLTFPVFAGPHNEGDSAPRFDLGRLTLRASTKVSYPQSVEPTHRPISMESVTPDPFVLPESIDVQVPRHVSSDLETGLNVLVSIPTGCYSARIKVEHLDDFNHRLTPQLVREAKDCVQYSRLEYQVVSLGRLLPGRHELVVENTMQPVDKKTFWVNDADLSASNKPLRSQSGGRSQRDPVCEALRFPRNKLLVVE